VRQAQHIPFDHHVDVVARAREQQVAYRSTHEIGAFAGLAREASDRAQQLEALAREQALEPSLHAQALGWNW
jgi:hypothetical protein